MLTDLPTNVSATRTRDQHFEDHNRIHERLKDAVYSGHYASLQAAVNDAITRGRPLIIAPGIHNLSQTLLIDGAINLHVFAYGSRIRSAASMTALLEVRDTARCSFHGLRLEATTDNVVDNMLYVRRDDGFSHNNAFYDTWVQGEYKIGIRIGTPGDGGQCDDTLFMRTECSCTYTGASTGVICGDGIWGNNMLHKFYGLSCSGHSTHFHISQAQTHLDGGNFDRADLDILYHGTTGIISNMRCEESKQFLVSGGVSTFGTQLTIENCQWHGQDQGGNWIDWRQSGILKLNNVEARNAPAQPVIYARPGAPLHIVLDSLMCGGDAACPHESAFDVNANTTVVTRAYIELDSDGAVDSVTID
ncbi:MAG: hypothetical protein CL607_15035 [Anaerolineaceae bacterium]|nr:hypothetical protein [Anaerolineaceae bacterium]